MCRSAPVVPAAHPAAGTIPGPTTPNTRTTGKNGMRTTHRWLDEAGHVYVAEGGPQGQCVRLNTAASAVWRALLAGQATPDQLEGGDRTFALSLVADGVLLPERSS